MANIVVKEGRFVIDGTNAYLLRNGQSFSANTYIISIIDTGSLNGTVTVKARPQSAIRGAQTGDSIDTSAVTPLGILYTPRYLNGSVGDEVPVNTGITTTSIIAVDASGLDIVLDASVSSGSATVYVSKLKG
jgi:hypothetical protein